MIRMRGKMQNGEERRMGCCKKNSAFFSTQSDVVK